MTLAVEIVWWLSVAVVAVAAVLLVFVATHRVGGGAVKLALYFQLPARAYHVGAGQLAGEPGRIGLSDGQVAFAHPRLLFVLFAGLVMAVAAAAWLFIVGQLRGLLAALRAGEPFARENELRLRRIGVAVIGASLAGPCSCGGRAGISIVR